jgi:ribonuclease P protein component
LPVAGPKAASAFRLKLAKGPQETLISRAEALIPILPTLKARAEFLAVRGGRRSSTPAFLVEMRPRPQTADSGGSARFGFTVTKKLGNAVTRNRIRRRLKAAFAAGARDAEPACDYVIVARHAALERPYSLLLQDVTRSLVALRRTDNNGPRRTAHRSSSAAAGKKGSA